MRRIVPVLFALWFAVAAPPALPQETESAVPELEAFHEVIYPIWHTAYPEKDIAALKGFVPEIERLAGRRLRGQAPRHPQGQGSEVAGRAGGVPEVRRSLRRGGQGTGRSGPSRRRGGPPRPIRDAGQDDPPRPQGDGRVPQGPLCRLSQVPSRTGSSERYRAASPDLEAKAGAVAKATLSKRMESRAERFQAAAADLVAAAASLAAASRGTDDAAVEKAVLALHEKYVALEKVFD